MAVDSPPGAPKLLSLPTILAFATSSIPTGALVLTLSVYMPRYFAGQIGISLGAVGAAFTLVRLIDIGFDPLMGLVMDRTRSPIGRYRPWMIVALPILLVAVYALFMAPKGVSQTYLICWLLTLYVGNSIFLLAMSSWAAKLAATYDDRSRMFAIMGAVGVLGALLVLLLPILSGNRSPGGEQNIHAMGWFVLIALPLSVALVAFRTPEPVASDVERPHFGLIEYWRMVTRPDMARIILVDLCLALGPGTSSALYLFFFHDSRGFSVRDTNLLLMWYIVAGLGAPLLARAAVRFGKHQTLIACTIGYAISQSSLFVLPKANFLLAMPGMMICGILAGGFTLLVRAMVADVGDDVRLQSGHERVGLLYAMVTSTQKIGGAITIGIPLMVLDRIGYNATEGAVNTPAAIHGLEMCYLFAPVIFVLLGGLVLFGYNLDADRHAEIRKELEARDALLGQSAVIESLTGAGTLPGAAIDI